MSVFTCMLALFTFCVNETKVALPSASVLEMAWNFFPNYELRIRTVHLRSDTFEIMSLKDLKENGLQADTSKKKKIILVSGIFI